MERERQKWSKWWQILRSGGLMANLQSELVEEEMMPTLEDQQMVGRGVGAKWKTRQRLRNSPR